MDQRLLALDLRPQPLVVRHVVGFLRDVLHKHALCALTKIVRCSEISGGQSFCAKVFEFRRAIPTELPVTLRLAAQKMGEQMCHSVLRLHVSAHSFDVLSLKY